MTYSKGRDPQSLLASYGADRNRWVSAGYGMGGQGTPEMESEAQSIDSLLDLASTPDVSEGAVARLLDQLPVASSSNVTPFLAGRPRRSSFMRYATLPLAASLALGVYLGAQGSLDVAFPTSITGTVALGDDSAEDLGGVGDLDAYAEDSVT